MHYYIPYFDYHHALCRCFCCSSAELLHISVSRPQASHQKFSLTKLLYVYIYIYTYEHICIYMYLYIYVRDRVNSKQKGRATERHLTSKDLLCRS